MLTTCGRQFADWSAAYRLFEQDRFDVDSLFAPVRRAVAARLAPKQPFVIAIDDSHLPKKGRKVGDTAWRHNHQGPKWKHQIHWAQRFVQLSTIRPSVPDGHPRAIPLDVTLLRVPKKPKTDASEEELKVYRTALHANTPSAIAVARLRNQRKALDADGHADRLLLAAVDGGYTNETFLSNLPERTAVVGRVRKDAKLFAPPPEETSVRRGRKRYYGDPLPTPEQLLEDKTAPVVEVRAYAAGAIRTFRVKTIERCRWPKAGGDKDLRLVVLEPLSLHPHEKGSTLYFAHPGYLLCTDPGVSLQTVVQAYVDRWEIEVDFRDEKTIFGVGQAQVRQFTAVERVPQFQIAAYALLLLAVEQTLETTDGLPRPKWRQREPPSPRLSTQQAVSILRHDVWGKALGIRNKTDFVSPATADTKPPKLKDTLCSAVLYATA